MEEHPEVGQERIDALAVRRSEGQLVEWVGHKPHYGDEEGQDHHQRCRGIGQRVLDLFRRPSDRDGRHYRQHKGDVEQGAFVAGVKGHPGKYVRHRQVAVGGYVGDLKVPIDKCPDQAQGGHQHYQGQQINGASRAYDQCRHAPNLPQRRPEGGVGCQGQSNPQ